MRFLLDENLPASLVLEIRKLGFEAESVYTTGLVGAQDQEIVNYAREHQAILVTKDLELGSLLFYPQGSHHGLIILRLPSAYKKEQLIKAVISFLSSVKKEDLIDSITVLSVGRYRQRRLGNGA